MNSFKSLMFFFFKNDFAFLAISIHSPSLSLNLFSKITIAMIVTHIVYFSSLVSVKSVISFGILERTEESSVRSVK